MYMHMYIYIYIYIYINTFVYSYIYVYVHRFANTRARLVRTGARHQNISGFCICNISNRVCEACNIFFFVIFIGLHKCK